MGLHFALGRHPPGARRPWGPTVDSTSLWVSARTISSSRSPLPSHYSESIPGTTHRHPSQRCVFSCSLSFPLWHAHIPSATNAPRPIGRVPGDNCVPNALLFLHHSQEGCTSQMHGHHLSAVPSLWFTINYIKGPPQRGTQQKNTQKKTVLRRVKRR